MQSETEFRLDTQATAPSFADLVERIRQGDQTSCEELYHTLQKGAKWMLQRRLGNISDAEDNLHEIFLIVVSAIQRGTLRDPERLMGFVRTVISRKVAAVIEERVHSRRNPSEVQTLLIRDPRPTAEWTLAQRTEIDTMKLVMRELSARDREILERFYLQEQTQEEICAEMDLTDTQFRLLKSRAKSRFGELGQKRMSANRLVAGVRSSMSKGAA